MKHMLIPCALLMLAACGGPVSDSATDADIPPEFSVEAATSPAEPAAEAPHRGLFGRRAPKPETTTPDTTKPEAAPPDPAIAIPAALVPSDLSAAPRVLCGPEARSPGKTTAEAAGFRLHDPAPGSVSPRAVRITGFADGCAREITGAVVLFGRPALYELTRGAQRKQASGPTDIAYDALKSKVCGGPATCAAVQDRAVFVTAHGKAGEDTRWVQMLLADGALLASEVKTP